MSTDGSATTSNSTLRTMNKSQQLTIDSSQSQRRSSSRSIKRKKFDDELVESSIITPKGQRGKQANVTTPVTPSPASASNQILTNLTTPTSSQTITPQSTSKLNSPSGLDSALQLQPLSPQPNLDSSLMNTSTTILTRQEKSSSVTQTRASNTSSSISIETSTNASKVIPSPQIIAQTTVATPATTPIVSSPVSVKKPKPITTSTKRRRYRNAHNNAVKDLGRWKPQDDLALVIGVQQLNDLEAVYKSIKFSCKFTPKEIENRWFGLLYDPLIAKIGVAAMRQLHPDIVAKVHANSPYNEEEENLLKGILSNSHPTIEIFEDLLQKHIDIFLPYRKATNLRSHWVLLKYFHLLDDQNVKNFNKLDDVLSFSDVEEQVENELHSTLCSNVPPSPAGSSLRQEDIINQELALNNRKTKREVRQLENEIPKWQVLVDSLTGVAPSDFDNETLAVLRGRQVRYLMRSREITLGRNAKESIVDVDLSLEGPSNKISRKQALIKLNSNGDFLITNTGKRAFIVDAKPVLGNLSSCKLNNNSVVEIAGLRFVFLINQDLIGSVRAESFKNNI